MFYHNHLLEYAKSTQVAGHNATGDPKGNLNKRVESMVKRAGSTRNNFAVFNKF